MISGRLRYSVTLQRRSTSKNTRGEYADSWSTVATRRASIEPINGREYWAQSGEHASVTTRIRIRYDASLVSLRANDRVLDHTHSPNVIYDIESIIRPRETANELVLMCVRRSGQQG